MTNKLLFVVDMPHRNVKLDEIELKNLVEFAGLSKSDRQIRVIHLSPVKRRKMLLKELNPILPAFRSRVETALFFPPDLIVGMGSIAIQAIWKTYFEGRIPKLKDLRNRVFVSPCKRRFSFTYALHAIDVNPSFTKTIVEDLNWMINYREDSRQRLKLIIDPKQGAVSSLTGIDIESQGFTPFSNDNRLLTVAVSPADTRAFGLSMYHPEVKLRYGSRTKKIITKNLSALKAIVGNPNITLVQHNLKFDALWIEVKTGFPVLARFWDTKVAASLLWENDPDNSLKSLCARYTDLGHYGDDVDRKNLANESLRKVHRYNMKDAIGARRLKGILHPMLRAQGLEKMMDFLMVCERTLLQIEKRGVYVDQTWAAKEARLVKTNREKSYERLCNLAGYSINANAPDQVADLLFNQLRCPVTMRSGKTNKPSTNKDAVLLMKQRRLNSQQRAGIDALEEHRKWSKLKTTYFDPLPEFLKYDGRIHTTYNLGKGAGNDKDKESGARTGRLSSSNPNLQNIPIGSSMRGMFAAPSNFRFLGADYSQLELRVCAQLSQEPAMLKMFEDGYDIHTAVLAKLRREDYHRIHEIFETEGRGIPQAEYEEWYKLRVGIKRINFGVLYGIGPKKLSRLLLAAGVRMSPEEIDRLMKEWFEQFPRVVNWINRTKQEAIDAGQVRMPHGRIRHLMGANNDTPQGWRVLRQAVNSPIQSLASDITLAAMNIVEARAMEYNLLAGRYVLGLVLQVHDMIAGEWDNAYFSDNEIKQIVVNAMTSAVTKWWKNYFNMEINVPLEAKVTLGERWS